MSVPGTSSQVGILLPSLVTIIFVKATAELPFILVFLFFGLFMLHEGTKAGRTYQQAVENTILLEQRAKQLRRLSVTDDLTGVKNRRFFAQHFEGEWRRAHRQQSSLSVLMVDLDRFKVINDSHGHLLGDECLKAVSATLRRHVYRPSDIVARSGGDEFVVVLPDTDLAGAVAVADLLLKEIRRLVVPSGSGNLRLTTSIGLASALPDDAEAWDALLSRADRALYAAKRAGSNCLRADGSRDGGQAQLS